MAVLDIPKYKVHPRPERFLINKILALIGLGMLLYIGIYINYYLLNLDIPPSLNWIFITIIIILLVLEALLCYMRYGHYTYEFHDDRIIVNEAKLYTVSYSDIANLSYAHNFLDNWLRTGSIIIVLNTGKTVKLRYLENVNQAYFWLQKAIHNK